MSERAAAAIQTTATAATENVALQRTCACGSHTPGGGTCARCGRSTMAPRGAAASMHPRPGAHPGPELHGPRGPGHALDPHVRTAMETHMGRDFSGVRVHHDGDAARAAASIGAAAYTVGDDVVFGPGRYRPSHPAGLHLLTHELAHVAQHRAFGAARALAHDTVGDPHGAAEQDAHRVSARVMRGQPARVAHAPQARVHRLSEDETTGLIAAGSLVGAGLLGVGIAWLAGAFDRTVFSDAELRNYLDRLARARATEGHTDSDNKARDLVRRWSEGDRTFDLDAGHRSAAAALTAIELKRLLIREMLDGPTTGDDENAILLLLERASTTDLVALLDPNGGVSVQDMDSDIDGDHHDRFERLLERRFPAGSPQRQQTAPTCSARQALMVSYARDRATQMVRAAIAALGATPRTDAVNRALACRFNGANQTQIGQIRAVYERVLAQLPQRMYQCGADRGAGALEGITLTLQDGRTHTAQCITEFAEAAGLRNPDGSVEFGAEVALCPQFFRQDAAGQAVTLVHESAHAAGLLTDPQYQPGCGIALATAMQNPDSFAYFANDLMGAAPTPASGSGPSTGLPRVTVGNFRNSGALSDENRCEVCADLPGLGLDTQTFQNFMELRGDIDGTHDGVEFDFKRTKDQAVWRLDSNWHQINRHHMGSGDDRFQSDEFLTPVNRHIYTVDGPGFIHRAAPIPDAASAQQAVYIASYLESVDARRNGGGWSRVSNEFAWHSVSWVEKVGGAWQRRSGESRIEAGALAITDTPPQPQTPSATITPDADAATGTPTPVPATGEPE